MHCLYIVCTIPQANKHSLTSYIFTFSVRLRVRVGLPNMAVSVRENIV